MMEEAEFRKDIYTSCLNETYTKGWNSELIMDLMKETSKMDKLGNTNQMMVL